MKKRYEEISKSDWMKESLKHSDPDASLSGVVVNTVGGCVVGGNGLKKFKFYKIWKHSNSAKSHSSKK